ncbi:hypothetical protein JL720_6975 [Aureococcus anophagefferens]|nr:hypothetical protein JL720_6975 [Aureococcus anophagefferens]
MLGRSHRSMGKAWYATVGASLTLTMLTNVVVPQISFVQKVVVKELKRTALRSWVKTQSALDRLYTPTPWQIERSYAIALTTLFVTTLYAPGLPVLAAFATVACGVAYALNKVLVFKFCEQPPNYDETLGKQFSNRLYVMAALHFLMAVYALSEDELVHAPDVEAIATYAEKRSGLVRFALRRMAKRNVVPLWLAFFAYVAVLLLWAILGRPFLLFLKSLCGGGAIRDLAHVHRQAPYSKPWTSVAASKALRLKATAAKRVGHDDGDLHLAHGCTFYRRWEADALSSNGHKRRRAGDVKLAWEVMAKADLESYNIVRNPKYERVMALLDKLGYAAVDEEEAICRPSAASLARSRAAAQEAQKILQQSAVKAAWAGGDGDGADDII